MDGSDTIESLKEMVIRFRDARNWEQYHDPKNLAMGLSIECAELQEVFLWKKQEEITALLKQEAGYNKVKEELADIFVFLLYLAEGCKVDLSEAVREKIRRLERGLPSTAPVERMHKANGELTLGGLIDRYEVYRRTKGERIKNLAEQLRVLRVNLDPWLDKPAEEISKADIREARDMIAARGKLGASNKLLAYCQPVFKWASQEDIIPFNFIPDIVRLGAPQTRDRFLGRPDQASIEEKLGIFISIAC